MTGITKTTVWNAATEPQSGLTQYLEVITWFGSTLDPVPGEPDASAVVSGFFSSLTPRG